MTQRTERVAVSICAVCAAFPGEYHGTTCPAPDIEREAVEAYATRLREKVEGLIEEAGGRCVAPDDPDDIVCLTHSELMFGDRECEDQPRQLLAVLALIESEKP